MRTLVLISGRGSNLEALLRAIGEKRCAADIVGVIADRDAPGLDHAAQRNIATEVVRYQKQDRAGWEHQLLETVSRFEPTLIVLAGFMRLLSADFVRRVGPIINVHPSLLPAFPGMHATRQAIEAGVRMTGCTVHLVDEGVDTGRILAQAAVAISPGDDAAALQARIQRAEHQLLPAVVDAIARGHVDPRTGTWLHPPPFVAIE